MTSVTASRLIEAPVAVVYEAITDVENLPATNPDIVKVELLTEPSTLKTGTRFRETRIVNGKEQVTELEITEARPDARVRMVADSHGTVWDTRFELAREMGCTLLDITMEARAHALLPRLMHPLMKGAYRKGIERHLDALQSYCESRARK